MDFSGIMGCPVKTIVVHQAAHNDELFASYLLRNFGEMNNPGIQYATTEYWDSIPEGETWETLLAKEQKLLVGMGFSPLDDHLPNGDRVVGECAATLVASYLGIRNNDHLQEFLNFTLSRDTHCGKTQYELPGIIKLMCDADLRNEEVMNVMSVVYYSICNQALAFAKAGEDFKKAKFGKLVLENGTMVTVAYGFSDSSEFGKYARSKGNGIVIWAKSSGNVMIQTNHKLEIDLAPVIRAIRIREITAAGGKIPSDRDYLASGGTISECPNWFFHVDGRQCMNGSKTHSALRTRLSLEQLCDLVLLILHKKEKVHPVKNPYRKHAQPLLHVSPDSAQAIPAGVNA